MLQGGKGVTNVLQGVTRGNRGLQGVTGGTGIYKGLQGVTRGHKGL